MYVDPDGTQGTKVFDLYLEFQYKKARLEYLSYELTFKNDGPYTEMEIELMKVEIETLKREIQVNSGETAKALWNTGGGSGRYIYPTSFFKLLELIFNPELKYLIKKEDENQFHVRENYYFYDFNGGSFGNDRTFDESNWCESEWPE